MKGEAQQVETAAMRNGHRCPSRLEYIYLEKRIKKQRSFVNSSE